MKEWMRFVARVRRHDWLGSVDEVTSQEIVAEESTLFLSVLKWAIMAGAAGVIVGLATRLFLYLLDISINGGKMLPGKPFYYLPLVIPLVIIIVNKLAPSAKGHGTEKVIEAVHTRNGAIDIAVVPVKLFVTLLTIGSAGSVGKEGPAAQIGAGLAYRLARIFRLNKLDSKKLVICGISAGFAAIFGTPISGALFGAEVLYLGLLQYDVLFPCLVAGVVAHIVCPTGHSVPHDLFIPYIIRHSHSLSVLIAVVSGIIFGIVALIFVLISNTTEKIAEIWRLRPEWKGLLAGIVLCGVFTISPRSAGLGVETLSASFVIASLPLYTVFWKMIATSLTLGFGGSGGIITPLFVIGATSGFAIGKLVGVSPHLMAAFGMVSVLAAATNTPIAASVMALELFGSQIGTYAAISACTAYIIMGHRGVYPSQLLGATKSASISTNAPESRLDSVGSLKIKPRIKSLSDILKGLTKR